MAPLFVIARGLNFFIQAQEELLQLPHGGRERWRALWNVLEGKGRIYHPNKRASPLIVENFKAFPMHFS